jgi:hypothetical protein
MNKHHVQYPVLDSLLVCLLVCLLTMRRYQKLLLPWSARALPEAAITGHTQRNMYSTCIVWCLVCLVPGQGRAHICGICCVWHSWWSCVTSHPCEVAIYESIISHHSMLGASERLVDHFFVYGSYVFCKRWVETSLELSYWPCV